MSDSTRDLAAYLNKQVDDARNASPKLRQGVVQTVNGSSVTLTLNGTSTVSRAACLASYFPAVGDTVWVLRSGTDMIVLGTLASFETVGQLPSNGTNAQNAVAQSNSANTYQNLLVSGSVQLAVQIAKKSSASALHVQMTGGAFASASGVIAQFLAFDAAVGAGPALPITQFYFNAATQHQGFAGQTKLFGIPAGNRLIVLQFRNIGAAGNVNTDGNDWFTLSATETAT